MPVPLSVPALHCSILQGRRSRCGRCGGRQTNNMLSLASKLLNLAVSSKDCTRNDLRRSKIQNFRPPYVTRFARLLHFLVGALCAPCHCAPTISSLKYAKRSSPDQTNIASYGPVLDSVTCHSVHSHRAISIILHM